jgi:signal transduction histidine kinase
MRVADAAGDRLEIEVRDNGRGIESGAEVLPRFGILGMRERVQALHGSFALDSQPGKGLRVKVTIPVVETAAAEQGAGA